MHDVEYKSRLRSHAGFYFCVAGIAFLVWNHGFRGLLWRDALYFVLGYIPAAVVLGSLHWTISRWFEKRHSDISFWELLIGSERLRNNVAKAGRLGTLFTLIALAAGLASVFAYDLLMPR